MDVGINCDIDLAVAHHPADGDNIDTSVIQDAAKGVTQFMRAKHRDARQGIR